MALAAVFLIIGVTGPKIKASFLRIVERFRKSKALASALAENADLKRQIEELKARPLSMFETLQAKYPTSAAAEQQSSVERAFKPPNLDVMAGVPDASAVTGISVVVHNHPAGILIGVTQSFDTIRSYTCTVSILDMRKIDAGQSHSVAELHERDGEFRFKGVCLVANDANQEDLFYKAERRWWLTEGSNSTPRIRHWRLQNNNVRGMGVINLATGTWLISLEVTLTHPEKAPVSLKRDFTFLWDGTKTPHAVD